MAEINSHQYEIDFRCPNCGTVFSRTIQKGVQASGMGGVCPYCGVKDGQPQIGRFEVIKKTPDQNSISSEYQGLHRPPV
jgi:predicted RNA-binding Zn-ribbon protein involved in translation (DUF1610 family)